MKVHLTPVDIIRKKRDGKKLSKAEIEYFISEYTKGNIADYQMSAFLMAVYFQNMDFEETAHLMQAMMESGATMHLPDIRPPKVDKHSTGGVGDKVSLILAPLVAACGICVPMISGRGLGHTGGTLDKLESIPGFNTDLKIKRFKRQLQKIGVAMIGQTAEVAPADKKMYALRDVTATVDSIPLIAASIMSKKLAEDLDGLVLDVKFGNGAFMQDYKQARMLAVAMVEIGRRTGVKTVAVMTNMNDPLGVNVGNSLEVIEAIEALKGRGPRDLMDVTFALGAEMLNVVKIKGGRKLLEEKIANGAALEKFREIIEYQGGDTRVVDDHSYLPVSKKKVRVLSHDSGYVHEIDCFAIGMLLVKLGGGRTKKEDSIDASCGFKIYKKTGDYVKKEMCLAEAFGDNRAKLQRVALKLKQAFSIRKRPPKQKKLIREIVKY
ncbi:MAG: thymidine phosphorylase [candidate division WOR-3 bacterium]|nr:MAG: thymidine phosphorylase [candidate division WOR-3 bacterium]